MPFKSQYRQICNHQFIPRNRFVNRDGSNANVAHRTKFFSWREGGEHNCAAPKSVGGVGTNYVTSAKNSGWLHHSSAAPSIARGTCRRISINTTARIAALLAHHSFAW